MENKFLDESDAIPDDNTSNIIHDYVNERIMTLEEAVTTIQNLIPRVSDYVKIANSRCTWNENSILTKDEHASIYLYTMTGIPFYKELNDSLRCQKSHRIEPWYPYLKLLITALNKLPSFKGIVWRGQPKDISSVDLGAYGRSNLVVGNLYIKTSGSCSTISRRFWYLICY